MVSVLKNKKSPLSAVSKAERKIIKAWCMYDWANSGFATSVVAAILPVYFVSLYREGLGSGTVVKLFWLFDFQFSASVVWAFTGAFGTLIVALCSPVLGVIADRSGLKKKLMTVFCITGCLSTGMLFFSAYFSSPWLFLLAFYFLAAIGFAGSNVFYHSLLPHIAPEDLLDNVSSRGYAYGYLGGGLLLLIHVVFMTFFEYSDLSIRLCIASVGVWWFCWALWTLIVVPEPPTNLKIMQQKSEKSRNIFSTIALAFKQLRATIKEFKDFKVLLVFLIAFIIFNDSIQTVLGIAGAFGVDVLRISPEISILTILIVQFVATPGSILFSYLSTKIGTMKALVIAVSGWGLISVLAVGFAPLELQNHEDFDYQAEYDSNSSTYIFSESPTLSESNITENEWSLQNSIFLNKETLTLQEMDSFTENFSTVECVFSLSIKGGSLNGVKTICDKHPTKLNQNFVDYWPKFLRMILWSPLGINQDVQFIILGIMVGSVMGGSQALSRSLFAYMVPKSRSGEFFGLFSFSWRAVSVIGPLSYGIIAGLFTPRTGLIFISIQIFVGVYILKFVDVKKGREVAVTHDRVINE